MGSLILSSKKNKNHGFQGMLKPEDEQMMLDQESVALARPKNTASMLLIRTSRTLAIYRIERIR